jgi:hypothetical protein
MPGQESSHVHSAQSARSSEGNEHPAKPTAAHKELAALVEHGLLDDLVRSQQDGLRDRQAQRLRGFEVDDQLERGGLLDREIRRLYSFENLIDEVCGAATDFAKVSARKT